MCRCKKNMDDVMGNMLFLRGGRFMNLPFLLTTVLLISLFIPLAAFAKPPAPLDKQAAAKLNAATKKVKQPVPKPGATQSDNARLFVEYWKKVYSAAGYDFEKSIVQLNKDLATDPEYISKISTSSTAGAIIITAGLVSDLNQLFIKEKLNPKDYFSSSAAQAFFDIKALSEKHKANAESAKTSEADALRKGKEENANGIYRGVVFAEDGDIRGQGYYLSDAGYKTIIFGMKDIASYSDLEDKPQLREQLKRLVGKRVIVKSHNIANSTQLDLDKGIEIIPD